MNMRERTGEVEKATAALKEGIQLIKALRRVRLFSVIN
jgi:hypothetical protein